MPAPDAAVRPGGAPLRRRKKKKRSSGGEGGGGGIRIRAFARPPSVPADFYPRSEAALLRALGCVLREEPLYVEVGGKGSGAGGKPDMAGSPAPACPSPTSAASDDSHSALNAAPVPLPAPKALRPVSREELYRLVEDVVAHGHGPELYAAVVAHVGGAAKACLSRMEGRAPGCVRAGAGAGAGGGGDSDSGSGSGSGGTAFLLQADGDGQPDGTGSAAATASVLAAADAACSSYHEYLRCVRSVFLHLDRRFVWIPAGGHGPEGRSGAGVAGRAAPRGSGPGAGGAAEAAAMAAQQQPPQPTPSSSMPSAPRAWSLWDVGMASLHRHMTAGEGDRSHRTVLATVVSHSAAALLRSLSDLAVDGPLLRSVLRTVGDLGPGPAGGLLSELAGRMEAYFDAESERWMSLASSSSAPALSGSGSGSGGDVAGFLRHVDGRLIQVSDLASTYLSGLGAAVASSSSSSSSSLLPSPSSPFAAPPSSRSPSSSPPTSRLLLSIVERRLLAPHYGTGHVLDPTVLHPLLDDPGRTVPDVRRLYLLGRRLEGGFELLRKSFGTYGREKGLAIVRGGAGTGAGPGTAPPSERAEREARGRIVPNLLAYKAHLEDLQERAFGSDEALGKVVTNVVEEVCNSDGRGDGGAGTDDEGGGRRVAELLAKHVDARFKNAKAGGSVASSAAAFAAARASRGGGTASLPASAAVPAVLPESEDEAFQNAVLSLFRHIHSKDTFEAFYKRDLAKRLLLNKSVSLDVERSMVSKLKAECGGGYTAKMEGMFKDVELSRDVMANYAAHLNGLSAEERFRVGGVEMDVQVLTTGYWPNYPQYPNLVLPSSLALHKQRFEKYYSAKYQGRRIAWQHALGNCIVRANFPKCPGPRDLIVSLCQSLVLICFNLDENHEDPEEGKTISDVMRLSGIEDRAEAERVLQSLSLGRDGTRVLLKYDRDGPDDEGVPRVKPGEPRKPRKVRRSVSDHDVFKFNRSFTSNQRRIRITNVQMKETSEDRSKTHAAVSRDRLYLIDASVVRIMKARKTLEHRALMGETMAQLKFPATSADIKKRIESLIEREYIERADGDRSRYNYLA